MLAWPSGPARIQQRAVAGVLRAVLGPIAPELDDAQIDAALLAGRLDVRRIRLDPAQLAAKLSLPGLTLTRAELGGLQVILPPLSQWWGVSSSPIQILLEQVHLDAVLSDPGSGSDAAARSDTSPAPDPADLADTLTRDLTQSLHLAASEAAISDASAPPPRKGEEPSGFFARWTNSLLSRIHIELDRAIVRLSPPHSVSHAPTLVMHLDALRIAPNPVEVAHHPLARTFTLGNASLAYIPSNMSFSNSNPSPETSVHPVAPELKPTAGLRSSSSSDSDSDPYSDSGGDEAAYLAMSSAVMDLRQSVYHDAISNSRPAPDQNTKFIPEPTPIPIVTLSADARGKVGVSPACAGSFADPHHPRGKLQLDTLTLTLDRHALSDGLAPWANIFSSFSPFSSSSSSSAPSSAFASSTPNPTGSTIPAEMQNNSSTAKPFKEAWSLSIQHVRAIYRPPPGPHAEAALGLDLGQLYVQGSEPLEARLGTFHIKAGDEPILTVGNAEMLAFHLHQLYDRSYDVSLPSITGTLPLPWIGAVGADMQRAYAAFTSPSLSPPRPSSSSSIPPSRSSAPASALATSPVRLTCPHVGLTLPVPRHVHPPSAQALPSRAGTYHLTLTELTFAFSPHAPTSNSTPSNPGTKTARFAPAFGVNTLVASSLPDVGRLSIQGIQVRHTPPPHAFPSPPEDQQEKQVSSIIILSASRTTGQGPRQDVKGENGGVVQVNLKDGGGTHVHASSLDLHLDLVGWAQLEMALDDLACWSASLPTSFTPGSPADGGMTASPYDSPSLGRDAKSAKPSSQECEDPHHVISLDQVCTRLYLSSRLSTDSRSRRPSGQEEQIVLLIKGVHVLLRGKSGGVDAQINHAGVRCFSSPPSAQPSPARKTDRDQDMVTDEDSDEEDATDVSVQTILSSSSAPGKPCLTMQVRTQPTSSGGKTTRLSIALRDVMLYLKLDLSFLPILAQLAQTPEDTFVHVTPSELTEVHIRLNNVHVGFTAGKASGSRNPVVALVCPSARGTLKLTPQEGVRYAHSRMEMRILLLDHRGSVTHEQDKIDIMLSSLSNSVFSDTPPDLVPGTASASVAEAENKGRPSVELWLQRGFAKAFHFAPLEATYTPEHITVNKIRMRAQWAADTLSALTEFAHEVGEIPKSKDRNSGSSTSPGSPTSSSSPSSPRTLRARSVSPSLARAPILHTPGKNDWRRNQGEEVDYGDGGGEEEDDLSEKDQEKDEDFFAPGRPLRSNRGNKMHGTEQDPAPSFTSGQPSEPDLSQTTLLDLQDAVGSEPRAGAQPHVVRTSQPIRRDAVQEKKYLGVKGHTRAVPGDRTQRPCASTQARRSIRQNRDGYELGLPKENYHTGSTRLKIFQPAWSGGQSQFYKLLETRASKVQAEECAMKLDVHEVDVTIELYAGYDWVASREFVRSKASGIRRRLLRIKQLLDQGYTAPADTVPEAAEDLMRSVHLPLPTDVSQLQADGFLMIVQDHVGDLDPPTAFTSTTLDESSQPLPNTASPRSKTSAPSHSSSASTSRHRPSHSGTMSHSLPTKLARARYPNLVLQLRGGGAKWRSFRRVDPVTGRGSRLDMHLQQVEIVDEMPSSTWRTFMTAMPPEDPRVRSELLPQLRIRADGFPAPADAPTALQVDATNTTSGHHAKGTGVDRYQRPTELMGAGGKNAVGEEGESEYEVWAQLAPVRLHVDQDALDFLKVFFSFSTSSDSSPSSDNPVERGDKEGPFIRRADVLPIPIKLDYKPRRVNFSLLKQGNKVEMMNFFHFDEARLVLRHTVLHGIRGLPKLLDQLHDIWAPDVTTNQLTDVLSGIAPIRTVSTLGGGLAELALLPIEQYHKDGRPLRGFQLGVRRFAHTAALEAVRLGARLATGTQTFLQGAEQVFVGPEVAIVPSNQAGAHTYSHTRARTPTMSTSPPASSLSDRAFRGSEQRPPSSRASAYAAPPADLREGMDQAYRGLRGRLTSAAQVVLALPMDLYESTFAGQELIGSTGYTSHQAEGWAGREVEGAQGQQPVKAIPLALLRSAQGASQALSRALLGLQSSLQPTLARETKLKYGLGDGAEDWDSQREDEGDTDEV